MQSQTPPSPLLLVEDDTALRRTMARALAKRGYRVDEASTARQARQCLDDGRYDVVVTDLHLPGTGLDVIRSVRSRTSRVPVLVITADTRDDVRRQAVALGATRVIAKPVGLGQLVGAIEQARREHEEGRTRFGGMGGEPRRRGRPPDDLPVREERPPPLAASCRHCHAPRGAPPPPPRPPHAAATPPWGRHRSRRWDADRQCLFCRNPLSS